MTLFPIVTFDQIDKADADRALAAWGHWLGPCNRPFGIQSFGLFVRGALVSVAVSASTVVDRCAGYDRCEVIELTRQCSAPEWRSMTRVCVRLWRELAPGCWHHWQAKALVSYSNAIRHSGDIYRFDGWTRYGDVKGGAKVNYGRPKVIDPKTVWVYPLVEREASPEVAACGTGEGTVRP